MNFDFAQSPLAEPRADMPVQGMQGMLAAIRNLDGSESPILREIGRCYGESVIVPQITGTAPDVAEQLKTLFREDVCEGFMFRRLTCPMESTRSSTALCTACSVAACTEGVSWHYAARQHAGCLATATRTSS